tara:strand:+ start:22 stop:909 length:888 start_codon:yes stop_codon:yes gene_type:complete
MDNKNILIIFCILIISTLGISLEYFKVTRGDIHTAKSKSDKSKSIVQSKLSEKKTLEINKSNLDNDLANLQSLNTLKIPNITPTHQSIKTITTNRFGQRNKFQNNIGFVKDSVINRYTDNYSARRYYKNTENNKITFMNTRYTDDDSGGFAGATHNEVLDKLNSFKNVFDIAQQQGKTNLFKKTFSGRKPFTLTYDYIPEDQYTNITNPYTNQIISKKTELEKARQQNKIYSNILQKLRREYKRIRQTNKIKNIKQIKNVRNQRYNTNNILSNNIINNNTNNTTLLNNNFIKNKW